VPVIPTDSTNIVLYAFSALGKQRISFQRLWLFLSFDIRQLPPSKAINLIKKLVDDGDLVLHEGELTIAPQILEREVKPLSIQTQNGADSTPELGALLNKFVGHKRLSSAVGIDDSAVVFKLIRDPPLRVEASIKGTRVYRLVLDEAARIIQHDCPDWLRKRKLRRFCKHVTKLFLLLEKESAVRILTSMLEGDWQFAAIR
jgi:hypothetical protein